MATCDGCGRRLTVVDPGQTRHPDPTCDPDPAPRLTAEVYAAWLAERARECPEFDPDVSLAADGGAA